MCKQRLYDLLRTKDSLQVVMWLRKEAAKPFFSTNCFGKIETVKN
jgi:hypothetical protein